jgi:aspartyl-tRNA(Asn)/glutamyl-tRNA(Gln) amidotransferase subunit A
VGVTRYATSSADWDPAAPPAFTAALTVLESAGAELVEVTVPYYAETTAANLLTMLSEALAYHRGDLQARWNDYHVRTRRTLLWGALVRGSDYVQSQRVRRVAQLALNEVFRDVDVIVSPTATIGAPPSHAFETDEGFAQLMAKVHTMYWDGVGNPVVAVPMGFTAERLPLSLQIAGRPFHEAAILRVAHAFQSRTDWHLSVPDLQGLTA